MDDTYLSLPEGRDDAPLTRGDGRIILYRLHMIDERLNPVVGDVNGLKDWQKDVDKERKLVKGVLLKAVTPGSIAALAAWFSGLITFPHVGAK